MVPDGIWIEFSLSWSCGSSLPLVHGLVLHKSASREVSLHCSQVVRVLGETRYQQTIG